MDFFHKTKPYGFAVKFNEDVRELIVIAQVEKECRGIWGVQVSEIVLNLRSTLDHLVWELVVHHTGSHPTSNKTQFPIFKTEAGYRQRTREYIRGVSPRASALIEWLQPFATWEGVGSPLWHAAYAYNGPDGLPGPICDSADAVPAMRLRPGRLRDAQVTLAS